MTHQINFSVLGKVRFFLGGGGGGGKGRVENFGIFFGKSVGPPLRLIQKPPEALPLSD